jgi:hypothetical protein
MWLEILEQSERKYTRSVFLAISLVSLVFLVQYNRFISQSVNSVVSFSLQDIPTMLLPFEFWIVLGVSLVYPFSLKFVNKYHLSANNRIYDRLVKLKVNNFKKNWISVLGLYVILFLGSIGLYRQSVRADTDLIVHVLTVFTILPISFFVCSMWFILRRNQKISSRLERKLPSIEKMVKDNEIRCEMMAEKVHILKQSNTSSDTQEYKLLDEKLADMYKLLDQSREVELNFRERVKVVVSRNESNPVKILWIVAIYVCVSLINMPNSIFINLRPDMSLFQVVEKKIVTDNGYEDCNLLYSDDSFVYCTVESPGEVYRAVLYGKKYPVIKISQSSIKRIEDRF